MMKHIEDFKQEAFRIALTSGLSRRRVAANLRDGLSTLGKLGIAVSANRSGISAAGRFGA
jgi:hypothetical protein